MWRRRIFTALTILCLILAIAVGVFWVWGSVTGCAMSRVNWWIEGWHTRCRETMLVSDTGAVCLIVSSWELWFLVPDWAGRTYWKLLDGYLAPPLDGSFLGIGWQTRTGTVTPAIARWEQTTVRVPCWMLFTLFAIPPTLHVVLGRARRKREKARGFEVVGAPDDGESGAGPGK